MADDDVAETIRTTITYGAFGFGVLAIALPGLFGVVYGLPNDPRVKALARLWGTRNVALGYLMLTADTRVAQTKMLQVTTALNAADAGLAVVAGGKLPARTRLLGGLSSAVFAGAAGYATTQSR